MALESNPYSGIVAVTGANGFIGKAVCEYLLEQGFQVRPLARQKLDPSFQLCPDLSANADWSEALANITCIIHCAGRAHVMKDSLSDPVELYRSINTIGTKVLAEQAAKSGIKKLIFLSSIKVNGEKTNSHKMFKFDDSPNPTDPYGISKWEAEQALWKVNDTTELDVVVIRLPLVYGSGVGGNFSRLIELVKKGWPLPFASIRNKRSIVSLANLLDLLRVCIIKKESCGKTFLVSDGYDLSTPELLIKLSNAMGKSLYLFTVPTKILIWISRLFGRGCEINRLSDSLQVDISNTCETLYWRPLFSFDEEIKKCMQIK